MYFVSLLQAIMDMIFYHNWKSSGFASALSITETDLDIYSLMGTVVYSMKDLHVKKIKYFIVKHFCLVALNLQIWILILRKYLGCVVTDYKMLTFILLIFPFFKGRCSFVKLYTSHL